MMMQNVSLKLIGCRGGGLRNISMPSGVTMGWLLRLVTGAPLVVGGPPTVLFYFKSEGRGLDLRK